ncbi:Retrovirus-related Pol polyprotein from transposon gypsy, partial [Mucuna pruriens]
MCIDYRDLNNASPKDNFPLPHINILVDNTAQHAFYSFMDVFSRYNQIRMVVEDKEKTTFITTWGTFYYKVMPFGLKNARATYQRAMVTLFYDMMHKEVEVYVEDMIAKSRMSNHHVEDLIKLFKRLLKYKLRLNQAKCTLGVKTRKLQGFIVSERGIEVDPDKVKAIQNMPPPRTETEEESFEKVKQYLETPPVLVPAIPRKPLILFLAVLEESMGCVLGQQDASRKKEQAIYYLSKKFIDCEQRYPTLEQTCYALVWMVKRLR